MIGLIVAQGIILCLVMAAAWWFQKRWDNAGWVDVFWTFGTGGAGIFGALWPIGGLAVISARQIAVALLAAYWAFRLGSHLRGRVLTRP
jgi:steroid 5-alpha reductase family enzyme